jgi:hypothetical protein
MTWDFRNLIRRGGGTWPRDWRDARRPIRAPNLDDLKPPPLPPPEPAGGSDEHWLDIPWQPEGSADAWRDAD